MNGIPLSPGVTGFSHPRSLRTPGAQGWTKAELRQLGRCTETKPCLNLEWPVPGGGDPRLQMQVGRPTAHSSTVRPKKWTR